MKKNPFTLCAILSLSLLSFSRQGNAELIAYEGFAQDEGVENPLLFQEDPEGKPFSAGGNGFQNLKGAATRPPLVIAEEGLSYDQGDAELKTKGRAILAPEGQSPCLSMYAPYDGDPFEDLRSKEDPLYFGREGKTLWVSWLFQVKGEVSPEIIAVAKIGSDAIHAGLIYNQKSNAAFLRLISSSTGVIVEPDQTYLMVVRIDYGSKEGDNDQTDRIMLWVNPDLSEEEPGVKPQAIVENVAAPVKSFWFMIDRNEGGAIVIFDELRIGEEYADVVPVL